MRVMAMSFSELGNYFSMIKIFIQDGGGCGQLHKKLEKSLVWYTILKG